MTDETPPAVPAPAGAQDATGLSSTGSWAVLPFDSQVLAVHAAVLPTGKVLFFAGSGNSAVRFADPNFGDTTRGFWASVVWDPSVEPGSAQTSFFHPDTLRDPAGRPVDFFCGGDTFTAAGNVLAAGGTASYPGLGHGFFGRPDAAIFDVHTQQWSHRPEMAHGRWYPTLLTTGDGELLAAAGLSETSAGNPTLELYSSPTNAWQQLNRVPAVPQLPLYAHLLLLADGSVFFTGGRMDDTNVVSPGQITIQNDPVGYTPHTGLRDPASRNQSASVLLPPAQNQQVMILGGGPGDQTDATNTCDIIDLTAATPSFHPAASMQFPRMHLNAVLLPDRTVLVVGGARRREDKMQASVAAEVYDPATDHWTTLASASVPRLYHSIALLLPDGRIVTASGNPTQGKQVGWEPPDPNEELRLEVFSPPYLFRGPQPVISNVPTEWAYGQLLEVAVANPATIKWISLVRNGVTTHSFNTSQRLVDLPIASRDGSTLQLSAPDNPNLAPPGPYMLFLINNDGVPSHATRIQLAAAPASADGPYPQQILTTGGLVGYWRLDEPTGTVAYDSHGISHGCYVNTPQLNTAGPLAAGGGAVQLDGSIQYVSLPRLVQDDFTLELWFQSTKGVGSTNHDWWEGAGLIDAEVPGVVDDFGTSLDAAGRVWAGTGNPDTSIASPPGLNDGHWHYLAFTRTRATGTLTLYLDGTAAASASHGGTNTLTSPPRLRLGMLQSGVHPLACRLSEAAVYSTSLTPSVIAAHHAAGAATV